jgi:hypothetical protein
MDLCTNAGIVSDALKFVERKNKQLEEDRRKNRRGNGRRENNKRSILITEDYLTN